LSAVDHNVAWASGTGGTVLRTLDGGSHWQSSVVPEAADLDFRDVHGVDANIAYLLSAGEGEKSRIYKTLDGGKTWTLQFMNRDPKAFFDGFAFWNANNGIAFSDPPDATDPRFLVIRTTDGGASWKETPGKSMPKALPGEAAFAASGSSIVVAGTADVWIATGGAAARVFHSSDRGLTWSVARTPLVSGQASAGIFSIHAESIQSLFVVGGDYQKENESSLNFAISKDGGRTWQTGPPVPGYRSAIHAVGDGLIAVGPSGTDLLAPGAGQWMGIGAGYDVVSFAPGHNSGWAAGNGGRIAKWQGLLR
jgi:photosystem II stability/assembly factor-like uncharacterized protein